ncbi:MAG: hypothetical protein AAFR35_01445 [Pseudomonadota bacterium]
MFGFLRVGQAPAQEFGAFLTARLNARVQPMDRNEYFEDPLDAVLKDKGLGEVTGGGTQMAGDPDGIEFVDLEIGVNAADDDTIGAVIAALEDAGAPIGSKIIVEGTDTEIPFGKLEGMGLYLNGTDLPDEVYANSDVNDVIARLEELLDGKGAFRGYWEGSRETALYFYGGSFESMRAAVQGYLDTEPATERTRVEKIA